MLYKRVCLVVALALRQMKRKKLIKINILLSPPKQVQNHR